MGGAGFLTDRRSAISAPVISVRGPTLLLGFSALCGLTVAADPKAGIALGVAIGFVGAAMAVPISWLAPVLLISTAAVPVALVESQARGASFASSLLAGQARMLIIVLFVALLRSRSWPRSLARHASAAALLYGGMVIYEIAATVIAGRAYGGMGADAYRQVSYMLAFAIGVLAVADARRRAAVDDVLRFVAIAAICVAASCCVFWAWTRGAIPTPAGFGRIFSDARNAYPYGSRIGFPYLDDSPNLAAVAFVLLWAFTTPVLARSRRRGDRALAAGLSALTIGAVIVTGSRTGLLALAAAVVVILIGFARRMNTGRLVLILGVTTVMAVFGYHTLPSARALSANGDTLTAREAIWKQAEAAALAHPLVGNGYRFSARDTFIEPATAAGSSTARQASVHNEYLGVFVDGGIIGGLFFIGFLCVLARLARDLCRDPETRSVGIASCAVLGALVVSMLAGASLQSAVIAIIVWLLIGIQSALKVTA